MLITALYGIFFSAGCMTRFTRKQKIIINCGKTLLEVEVDDDIVEKFTVIQTVEILVSHRYSTSSWRRGVSKQPAVNARNYQYVITN